VSKWSLRRHYVTGHVIAATGFTVLQIVKFGSLDTYHRPMLYVATVLMIVVWGYVFTTAWKARRRLQASKALRE
jgi:hypothetical protein